MNVIELKKMIYTFLKTKCARVYPEYAPFGTMFPYVTYTFSFSYTDDNLKMEQFTLEVDVWDNKVDTTALETLVGNIDGNGAIVGADGLNRKQYYVSGTLQTSIYRESRNEVADDDPAIRRRQLRYDVQSYLY